MNRGTTLRLGAWMISLTALLPVLAAGQTSPSAVEEGIAAVSASFSRALAAGDGAAAGALYTEDAIMLPPGGEMIKGWQRISDYWQQAVEAGLRNLETTTYEVIAGDTHATEVGRYRVYDDAGTVTENGKYMIVWKQRHGRWMLHRTMWNLTLEEE